LTSVQEQNEDSISSLQSDRFLQLERIVKKFSQGKIGFWSRVLHRGKSEKFIHAVDDVSLNVRKGETLVILGESGSGKTTIGRLIVGLDRIDSGRITLNGQEVKYVRDRGAKRGRLQMVFQDPGSSLDPYMTVAACVGEPLVKSNLSKTEVSAKASDALALVGLEGKSFASRKTSDLSGGQKQRVAIARALVSDPDVVVLDEPTSSIDVSIQAQVLNLLVDIQRIKRLTFVMISHDPNVARYMADNIAVMHLGRVVEYGPSKTLLLHPKHPYTQALLASAPKLGAILATGSTIAGDPQSMIVLPKGCRYEPRCPFAMEKCREREPILAQTKEDPETLVACYLYAD
jgi:peptide/nickel transport system ATP-binding protein